MSIPEDAIMFQLGMLIGDTDTSHYLHVVATEPGAPDGEFGTAVYVIDPVKDGAPAADGITTTITQARLDHDRRGATIHFIALNQRMWIVPAERADPMAHQLQHEGWLSEHPHAAEVSVVYAAARDGRRWRSRRWLTGERAGTVDQVEVLVGRPDDAEWYGLQVVPHLLRMVGVG